MLNVIKHLIIDHLKLVNMNINQTNPNPDKP